MPDLLAKERLRYQVATIVSDTKTMKMKLAGAAPGPVFSGFRIVRLLSDLDVAAYSIKSK